MENTEIYNLVILDESGSMQVIQAATIQGFNEVVQTIRGTEQQFPEQEHFVSLTLFNSLEGIRTKLDRRKASELEEISEDTFHPNSQTPLYDAIGYSIIKLRDAINSRAHVKVLVTIITDGEENASREYTWKQLSQIIKDLKRDGWTFTYIGANHDVKEAAQRISIDHHLTFKPTEEDMRAMFLYERNARLNYYQKIRSKEAVVDFFAPAGTNNNQEAKEDDSDVVTVSRKETLLDRLIKNFKRKQE